MDEKHRLAPDSRKSLHALLPPTFFINGVRLQESWEMETLQGSIEKILQLLEI